MKIKVKKRRLWTKDNIDDQVQELVENGTVSPVAWWLMASYAYYRCHISLLKDETFDWLGHWIKDNWDTIQHPNKRLISRDATFTGYYIRRYPTRVMSAAWQLIDELNKELA